MATIKKISYFVPPVIVQKRVAAYARVSMESEEMLHSLSAQVSYYSNLIQKNPQWIYAGVYVDEGITGTSTKNRDEFRRLMEDCDGGKIDMILVKSISRFARDTVDTLKTTRYLKSKGIDVYFEREKIHSLSDDGEVLLTLLASYAQEESRSISENIKWSIRKRFEQGIPNGHKAPFGYVWDGEMYRIIDKQGEVVKEIYERYLAGESAYAIAKSLAERGVKGQTGVPMDDSTIKNILSSHSYMGVMILQKNFFTEEHTRKRNQGELPRYVVEEMYESLVGQDAFNIVQEIRKKRAEDAPNKIPQLTAFSGKVKCGTCGCSVSRRTASNQKKWVCNQRERKGKAKCDMRPVSEDELKKASMQVLGLFPFEESAVKGKIASIVVHGDVLEFRFKDGKVKKTVREYGGFKGRSGFSGKIKCGICGGVCESDTWKMGPKGEKTKHKVWRCPTSKVECGLYRIMDEEIRIAAEYFLGEHYEAKCVELIEAIKATNDTLEFRFKKGEMKSWQRE